MTREEQLEQIKKEFPTLEKAWEEILSCWNELKQLIDTYE